MEPDPEQLKEIADAPVAMLDKDLRSMKDALLIETAEMLGVSSQSLHNWVCIYLSFVISGWSAIC